MLSTRRFQRLRTALRKILRFIYLNGYSFLLMICAVAVVLLPLRKVSPLLLFPQIIASFLFFYHSVKLFSTWKDKKTKYRILLAKNKGGFSPESFKIFMQAPCGRLLTKAVLKDLGLKGRYKDLLLYKEPFLVSLKNNFKPVRTRIYINEVKP